VRNNKLLYSTLLLIIVTLLVRWWVENQFALVERNEKFIAQAINKEVFKQEYDMIPMLDSLSLFGSSTLVNSPSTSYPFFIYEQGKLKYWSDFKYVPGYNVIKGNGRYRFLDNPYGQFIIRKWVVNYDDKSFEVFSLISLYKKYPINNAFITPGFNPKIAKKGLFKIDDLEHSSGGHIVEINGNGVCSILLEKGYKPSIVKPIFYIDFFLLLLQIVFFFTLYKLVLKKGKVSEMILLLAGWAYFKLVLPTIEGTTSFVTINIFDPQYYAVSWFERSFGDLLINTVFILLVGIRVEAWFRSKKILKLFLTSNNVMLSYTLRVVFLLITFWIINYPFFQLRSIYDNSQVSVDISQSLEYDWVRVITFLIIVFVNLSTFLLYHTIVRYVVRYTPDPKQFVSQLILALAFYLPLSYSANMPFANLAFINLLIVSLLWYFNIVRSLNTATYKRFLYIVLFFGIVASINGFFINGFESQKKVADSQGLIKKKLSQTDPFGEFLLSTALSELASDPFIIARMGSPFLSKNAIATKIRQVFLNSYLNKYEQTIVLFDAGGIPLKNFSYGSSIFNKLNELESSNSSTGLPAVFRVEEDKNNFSKHYIGYAPIKKANNIIGYVLVDLIERQFSKTAVYPTLLVDNRFTSPEGSETSFGYYLNGSLINVVGSNVFPTTLKPDDETVWKNDNLLYVSSSDGNRAILATSGLNSKKIFLSNLSFIWIITLFPILLFWLLASLVQNGEMKSLSYTDRIIWYLNLAFAIPLIIVTSVTFRLLSNSFENESNLSKTTLVERLSNQISNSLNNYINENEYNKLQERIEILSNNTELDINLFGLNGELITSSQPGVFNKKILAPFINQSALKAIKDKGKNHVVIQENIDDLIYSNSYVAVKSEDSGKMLGVISVPFFSSSPGLKSSKREAFNTILNVFVIVLFATMLATYFAGKWLTKPLKIIRDKLKSTSFSEQTEPISIQWSDELGLLIKAYNQMLATLEKSKNVLKQSEKEKAWREAAQQVAHEIKNPLTPMKLTLQRLTNKIKNDSAKPSEIEVPLQSVLHQVETLNNIASSFSEFAKMPTPVRQRVEIHSIIKKSSELFSGDKELELKLQLANEEVYSMVDPKLLSRMLNNLILNAKQSIKESQYRVKVEIITKVDDYVTIELRDNGAGIENDITDKVFIPKFTTKEQGSGIGLAMTKYGVENMGGKIYFTSKVNLGTTFSIEFPIVD
jgi:signal transduction histidine kinase